MNANVTVEPIAQETNNENQKRVKQQSRRPLTIDSLDAELEAYAKDIFRAEQQDQTNSTAKDISNTSL